MLHFLPLTLTNIEEHLLGKKGLEGQNWEKYEGQAARLKLGKKTLERVV